MRLAMVHLVGTEGAVGATTSSSTDSRPLMRTEGRRVEAIFLNRDEAAVGWWSGSR